LAGKRTALFVCPESPHPLIGGGPLRTASLLHYLLERYQVDAVLFRQPGAPLPQCPGASRTLVMELPHHSRRTAARVCRNLSRLLRGIPPLVDRFAGFEARLADFVTGRTYDLAVLEHLWVAPYISVLRPVCRRLVLDLHNIESEWHRLCAQAEPLPAALAMRRFAQSARRLESRFLPEFDVVLAASEEDARRATGIARGATVAVYPNVLPPPSARAREDDGRSIVFPGNLEYLPNRQAIRWFHSRVWPFLRRRGGVLWRILGCHPEAVPKRLRADQRIEVGPLGEDSIGALAKCSVGIAPLVSGSGTRLKILEMWAAGLPVVSTSLGAEGLGASPGVHLIIADEPLAFAGAIEALLEDPERRRQMGQAGRELLLERFTWHSGWRRLEAAGI
jgi:glycosyltransferase involved in cell wall biosynthesis